MSEIKGLILDESDKDLGSLRLTLCNGYARTSTKPQRYLHSIIFERTKQHFDKIKGVVDHVNRNKLDNRRCNLRFVSKSKNATNSKRSDSAKGYYWSGTSWVVKIVRNEKIHYKCFKDKAEAIEYANTVKQTHKNEQ